MQLLVLITVFNLCFYLGMFSSVKRRNPPFIKVLLDTAEQQFMPTAIFGEEFPKWFRNNYHLLDSTSHSVISYIVKHIGKKQTLNMRAVQQAMLVMHPYVTFGDQAVTFCQVCMTLGQS